MKTVKCTFLSGGKRVRKTAILNDSLVDLSKSRQNEATDIMEPDTLDHEAWGIYFEQSDTLGYEVQFEYDRENGIRTLRPVKAITWNGADPDSVNITDVQKVSVLVR